jgi:hypothetical protein
VMVLWEMHVGLVMTTMGGIPLCFLLDDMVPAFST